MKQFCFPARHIFYAGETVTFKISGLPARPGQAVLRTNLDRAAVRRQELIDQNLTDQPLPGLDWHDLKLHSTAPGEAEITLMLNEPGVFEAKCCFIPPDDAPIIWADGDNFKLKVEGCDGHSGNIIYCAFVRQFGDNLAKSHAPQLPDYGKGLDAREDILLPRSGSFRQLQKALPHIFDDLGCNILQLLPIHPCPVSYGRMGHYGSPFAALDYFSVDPALADFDPQATPLEQFEELIDAVHARNGRIFMDIPVNHTGWSSKLQNEHPEYFVRHSDGEFESPGAWGVVWADLCKLNYARPEVPRLMAKVFLFWCRRGVDGFRCDAGYMVPQKAWDYIVARVRSEFPETVFLLEGLGGRNEVQESLLADSDLDWGYSELFQNYNRDQISSYLNHMYRVSRECGNLVSFAETHDNARLAAQSPAWSRLRFGVTALLSTGGAFGFANGAEYLATEQIDVHGNSALNYGAQDNLNAWIKSLTTLLRRHPALGAKSQVQQIHFGPGNVIGVERFDASRKRRVIVLINLDLGQKSAIHFQTATPPPRQDLLSGKSIEIFTDAPHQYHLQLSPGELVCLGNAADLGADATGQHREMAMAHRVIRAVQGNAVYTGNYPKLSADPEQFAAAVTGQLLPPVTHWNIPQDARRIVPLPAGDLLLIQSTVPFRCAVQDGSGAGYISAIPTRDGRYIVLWGVTPNTAAEPRQLEIRLKQFNADGSIEKLTGQIFQMPPSAQLQFATEFDRAQVAARQLYAFGSNDRGSYALFPAAWGTMHSKYEALFAANGTSPYPVERQIYLSRCRAWLVVNGYSQEVKLSALTSFAVPQENCATWQFKIPAGQGRCAGLRIDFSFAEQGEAFKLSFARTPAQKGELSDTTPAKLILRPALEARINHELTKAFTGPEQYFPQVIAPRKNGFDFTPGADKFYLTVNRGKFVGEPEWEYMHDLPNERYYGLGDKTDLYSPGYFEINLKGGDEVVLSGGLTPLKSCKFPKQLSAPLALNSQSAQALKRFVVHRDELYTVLAGYPWFLDWGRDTLIVLRGLLAAPQFHAQAEQILRAFAGFEKSGTIPNMIRGNDDRNRDTSDAPLWLIVAVRDYIAQSGNTQLLDADCRGRKMRDILLSIVHNYQTGTPNGIHADPESGLIFSPSHFTWMDTNFPAGTPRQGYPIEIQSLWYAALEFLGFKSEARRVQDSIEKYYFTSFPGHCSDCLHAAPHTPAAQAVPDDHIRSNMLLAITMKAVVKMDLVHIILRDCEELLTPGGIRSLADRPTIYELPVYRDGKLLNHPRAPYRGSYSGPEDTARKVAYHNGTVWCWPFPNYCEALYLAGGEAQRDRALNLLLTMAYYWNSGVIHQLPEVADGDAPHTAGGCPAQAWSLSEFYRVYELLK